ncbi:MAG: TraB/GumN family protein [Caulobacteraceae bacterium]|jgi:uncharacterized protein YbaP (TraB family)|nr:TraB/GumN family protein [Caulobacteraceae bacterium]
MTGGLVAAFILAFGQARGQPAVWTVHGARGEVVLFGSVHLLPGGLDWRPPALERALARADDLWFELPLDQATDDDARRLTLRQGALRPGDSLWAHLNPSQRDRVERAAAGVGLSPAVLAPLRPWMAELTLSLAEDARAGAVAAEGVEARLQTDAPPAAHRHALETVRQQVSFLAASRLADQVASLDETAREMTVDGDLYARIVRDWLAGDVVAIQHDALDPLVAAAPAIYRRLIADRNRRWARLLARVARDKSGVTVVVVGAGHLAGPAGVPALLRAQGLRVDGP